MSKAPFETLHPQLAPPTGQRTQIEFVERDGTLYRHNKREGNYEPIEVRSGHALDDRANEVQTVFSKEDAREQIRIRPAEELIAHGRW